METNRMRSAFLTWMTTWLFTAGLSFAGENPTDALKWEYLAPLPDPIGVAGPFAGTHHNALIVAGGANFPGGAPWDGHPKVWHDDVFVLTRPDGQWKKISRGLSRKLAYGLSITTKRGVVCIGGCDADRCYADVSVLQWDAKGKTVVQSRHLAGNDAESKATQPLPDLPVPLAFMTGALVDEVIYVAGGTETMGPDATGTTNFWRLDLSKSASPEEFQWEKLPWPADASHRVLAVAAAQSDGSEDCFYLFSGRSRPGGGEETVLLRDAWRYSPKKRSWKRLAGPPRVLMAGAGVDVGAEHVLVLGGADGRDWGKDLKERHPGFAADMVFLYDTVTDRWTPGGKMPQNQLTTTAVKWHDADGKPTIVLPSGEIRPGVRSPKVLTAAPVRR